MSASSQFPDLQLLDWRRFAQATLRGFAAVKITPPGLIVRDVTLHKASDHLFALWPGKPQIDKDGRVLIDESGRRRYSPVVEVPDPEVRRRLSDAVVALIRERDPEALS